MDFASSSTVNSVNAKSDYVPKHYYMKRSCTFAIEDYITLSHIAKHIENENINIKMIKRINYKKEIHNANLLNILYEMSDIEYNNYVDNYNKHHTEQLERINRIFTSTYITMLRIMEVIQTNYIELKPSKKNKNDLSLLTVIFEDNSTSQSDSLSSTNSDNFSPVQNEKIHFLELISYYYKMSINEYNECIDNLNEKNGTKLSLIKKCIYEHNDNINKDMKIESINKTENNCT